LLPEVGYVRPLSDRVSVGIAIYGNGGMNTTYGKANPFGALGAQGTAGVDLKQGFITPTVAVKVTPDHSLGVSPVVVVQSFKARGIQPFAGAAADPANFTNRGTSWSAGGGVRVGYYGKLSDQISIGATYQTMLWTGKFQKYAGLFADSGSFDVPSQYGAGITFRPNKRLTLSADIKQIEYSDVESVGNPVQILFTGVPFGADEGPGFGWNDVTVVKFGAAYAASDAWTVRAGYGRNDNPVPQSQTLLNVLAPGIVQDHFTAGATWTSRSGLEVTGYVMHAPKNEVFGQASIPPNFGGGEANVRLSETSFGLAAGISF
jgi:long-chain fatty acid transport protein